jgi:hypothetical protein
MNRHIRILQVGLLAACASTATASIAPLGFSDGIGTNAVDQYTGVAGSGWVDGNGAGAGSGWVSATASASLGYAVSVANTNPLVSGGGNYLTTTMTVNDNTGSGQSRMTNLRRYDGGRLNTTNTYQFDVRIDNRVAFDSEFGDSLYFLETNDSGTSNGGSATSTSWQIQFRGNSAVTFQNGTTNTPATGFSWTTGITYRFTITSNPATRTWSFVATNANTGDNLYNSSVINWRNIAANPTTHGGYINFTSGLARGANQTGSSITYAVDNLSVVPEPAAAAMLTLAAAPLLNRRRRHHVL